MSHNLSQPEEVDLVFMELAENDMGMELLMMDKKHSNDTAEENQYAGYIPLYRKARVSGANGG